MRFITTKRLRAPYHVPCLMGTLLYPVTTRLYRYWVEQTPGTLQYTRNENYTLLIVNRFTDLERMVAWVEMYIGWVQLSVSLYQDRRTDSLFCYCIVRQSASDKQKQWRAETIVCLFMLVQPMPYHPSVCSVYCSLAVTHPSKSHSAKARKNNNFLDKKILKNRFNKKNHDFFYLIIVNKSKAKIYGYLL